MSNNDLLLYLLNEYVDSDAVKKLLEDNGMLSDVQMYVSAAPARYAAKRMRNINKFDDLDKNGDYNLTEDDVRQLVLDAGEPEEDYDEDNEDSILDAYARHIQNYLYTYKPEAQQLDASIDTTQEQIGPMAQDIEKVNPACINEVQGTKVVDTNKLSLMNAGAIADLARDMESVLARLKALEGGN